MSAVYVGHALRPVKEQVPLAPGPLPHQLPAVVVIRRLVDSRRAYTAIFLPGEDARVFPTSDYEHNRVLQIFRQDKPYAGILNDFTDFALGSDIPLGALGTGELDTATPVAFVPERAAPPSPFAPLPLALPAPRAEHA